MYKTIKSIKKLQFPLYAIYSNNWHNQDGIVFLDNQILDDLNQPGKSIGLRRVQSGRENLYKLKNPLFTLRDVLQSRTNHFVSSCGVPFTYIKKGFQKLKYHRIIKFQPMGNFTFVWLEGISIPFEIPRPPPDWLLVSWARVLYYEGHPWMIYDFQYTGNKKESRIKV